METVASGKILIAEPFMEDPYFKGAVVFLCECRNENAFGLILNKPTEMKVHEVVEDFPAVENNIFYGGPVQPNTLHYLHKRGDLFSDATEVQEGIYWGGDFEFVVEMIKNGDPDLDKIRFFLGYSGWSEGQLLEEMNEKTWLTVKGNRQLIFHPDHQEIWKDALKQLGGDYEIMINFPIDPQLN